MPFVGLLALGLLLGGWVLYPAFLWVLARLRPRKALVPPAGPEPDVEVIIATRDGAEAVRRRVANLLASDYPVKRLHVTVALDASAADHFASLHEALAGMPGVRLVRGDAPGGKAAALNAAVRAARASVLVFTDTAQTFEPRTIRALVRPLGTGGVVGTSGYLAAKGDRGALGRFWSYESLLRKLESGVDSLVGVTGAVYALKSDAWVPLKERLINDDLMVPLLARRAGGRIVQCPDAVAHDARDFTRDQQYARRVRTLTGIYQVLAWYPWVGVPWRNPLWIEFMCHKVTRLVTPFLVLTLGVTLLPQLPLRLVGGTAVVALLGVLAVGIHRRMALATTLAEGAWALRLLLLAPLHAAWLGLRREWAVWGGPVPGASGRG